MIVKQVTDQERRLIEQDGIRITLHKYGFISFAVYDAGEDNILLCVYDSRIESLEQCISCELIISKTWREKLYKSHKPGTIYRFGILERVADDGATLGPPVQIIEFDSKIVAKP